MKLPPFTLVYRPGQADFSRSTRARSLVAELDEHVRGIGSSLRAVGPAIRGALLATAQLSGDHAASAKQVAKAATEYEAALAESTRSHLAYNLVIAAIVLVSLATGTA